MIMRTVICTNCETPLTVDQTETLAVLPPCEKCGSIGYTVKLSVNEQITLHEQVKGKVKNDALPSHKKVRAEFITGEELRKSDGKWVNKDRYWNKDRDIYSEKVVDQNTGEVIHSCEEPLSKHTGHGSAKTFRK
jgi:hypothetical protein